ncbi:MAG TPA: MFS transporter [Rickettsia endosymbiont of Pyrocoelia pectoralis]|nr:MFS transporter [Rickettsia endosymbiont of Pyrocoelia pectoralis]
MLPTSRLFIIWLLGFISGFNIMISGNTLNYWLASENIPLQTIGIFAFITLPYSINFVLAPIFDTVRIKYLDKIFGHRLSWICLISISLVLSTYFLSLINLKNDLLLFGITALIISFFSAIQDTILSAFRTEIVSKEAVGFTSGIYIFGYRIGMLLAGSGAIYLSIYLTFNEIYKIFAGLVLIHSILLILAARYASLCYDRHCEQQKTTRQSRKTIKILRILLDCFDELHCNSSRNYKQNNINLLSFIALILAFLILYRLPDNFINVMINPFLLHLGYDAFEIASVGKFFGIIGAMVGGLLGGFIMKKKDIISSMLFFGIIHALAHILFIILEIYGKNSALLFITIGAESITGGMTMTVYIAFISSLCHGKFRATQYSFLSSMMGISRSIFPVISGYIVVKFGWQNFFFFATIITIPSLLMLLKIKTKLQNI